MANKKRLIDATVLSGLLDAEYRRKMELIRKGETHLNTLAEGFMSIAIVTGTMPTVDAVEVVRCVNCRSLNMTGYDEDNAQITDPLLQSGFCEMWGKDTQLCNFCSYGERRE